jgi:hypothetical protein
MEENIAHAEPSGLRAQILRRFALEWRHFAGPAPVALRESMFEEGLSINTARERTASFVPVVKKPGP